MSCVFYCHQTNMSLRRDPLRRGDTVKTGCREPVYCARALGLPVFQQDLRLLKKARAQASINRNAFKHIALSMAAADGLHLRARRGKFGKCGLIATLGKGIETRHRSKTGVRVTRLHFTIAPCVFGKPRGHGDTRLGAIGAAQSQHVVQVGEYNTAIVNSRFRKIREFLPACANINSFQLQPNKQ